MIRALTRALYLRHAPAAEREVLALLHAPDRWRPAEVRLAPEQTEQLAHLMASDLGMRLDAAMQHATVQQAQRACLARPDHAAYAAGFASGFRACWAVFRILSVPTDAQVDSEDPVMERADLDHIRTP